MDTKQSDRTSALVERNKLAQSISRDEEQRRVFSCILAARLVSALYSGIGDCDEGECNLLKGELLSARTAADLVASLCCTCTFPRAAYNYWEPLHLLTNPPRPLGSAQVPFQTWEYSPEYAIRSWAYLVQFLPIAKLLQRIFGNADKALVFYGVRVWLAVLSAASEAALVKAVAQNVSRHAAAYMLIMLACSAGMYESATALLPSSFVMYTTTTAMAFAMSPSTVGVDLFPAKALFRVSNRRTLLATASFALGALLAWPFALVVALPFVFEELFIPSGLLVPARRYLEFVRKRVMGWTTCVLISALIAVPILLIDSLAYGKLTLVPLNIIAYNVLSAKRGAGPELYGVEPWHYYLQNLSLNLGPALLLALLSLPLLLLLVVVDADSVPFAGVSTSATTSAKAKRGQQDNNSTLLSTSAASLLILRLLPSYLWLTLLTLQPHKEERFVYPIYPLLYFNAGVSLQTFATLAALVSRRLHPATASHLDSFSWLARAVAVFLTCGFSILRAYHTTMSYSAPIAVAKHLAEYETAGSNSPLSSVDGREAIRLCYGKEWHRFPTTYFVPEGVKVDFLQSDFKGILPKHFAPQDFADGHQVPVGKKVSDDLLPWMDDLFGKAWPWRPFTRAIQTGFNDLNLEEPDRYVEVTSCDYIVDLDLPHAFSSRSGSGEGSHEYRYAIEEGNWTRLHCQPFLDAPSSRASPGSSTLTRLRATIERIVWIPAAFRLGSNRFGDYCLLRTTRPDSPASISGKGVQSK